MKTKFSGTASGKFILLGEHFVVPSQSVADLEPVPALAFPLSSLRCEVHIALSDHPLYEAQFTGENVGTTELEEIESLMARAAYAAANSLRMDLSSQSLKIVSKANFPVSRGFGSSAAFSVALVRALDAYRRELIGENADWDEMSKAALAVERIFHGNPSGLDSAVIMAARPIRFERGLVRREITNRAVDFVLLDSGSRENCGELVRRVGETRAQDTARWRSLSDRMRRLVDDAESSLNQGEAAGVARAVDGGHEILSSLGLSNHTIDAMINDARSYGAIAGKVSGAGGGGAVLLVARKGDGEKLRDAMVATGRMVIAMQTKDGE